MNAATQHNMNRKQFIDGLYDAEIQKLLPREYHQNFSAAINRALRLDAVARNSHMRQSRRLASLRSVSENPVEIQSDTQSNEMMQRSNSSRIIVTVEILNDSSGSANAKSDQRVISYLVNRVTIKQRRKAMRNVCTILIRLIVVTLSSLSIQDRTISSSVVVQLNKIASVDDKELPKGSVFNVDRRVTLSKIALSFELLEAGRATFFWEKGFFSSEFKTNRLKDKSNASFDARKVKSCDKTATQQHVATNTIVREDKKRSHSADFDEGSEATIVDGIVNDPIRETLIDTGTSTSLMQAEKLFSNDRFARILQNKGRLESADGKTINVLGRAILELKLSYICEEIHVLVLQTLKPPMILGLKEMKRHGCTSHFRSNETWTASKENLQ